MIVSVFAVIALVGCRPSDPVQDVRDQIAAGQHREALEPLRDLIKETPEDMELLFLYGQVLVETGQPGLAEWPLRKAQTDPIWFVRASLLIASVEHTGGNAENAAETYAKVLEAHPDMMNVRIQRANVLARSPRLLHEALAEVDRILEMDPQQLSAYKPRILAYLGLNQPDDAERVLLELGARIEADQSEDDPIQGWHCATMAIFADDKGDEEVARTRWLDCIERYPTHPNVVGRAIGFYRKNLELESALEVARVAFEGDKGQDSGYRLVVSDLLRLLDRHDEAEALLIEGTEEATTQIGRSAALLALAEYYKQIGNLESSADALEKGLAATQKFAGAQPDLLFALADLRIQLGQSDLALELTSRMTVAAHRALVRGAVAHNRKEFAKAIQFYDEATRLWPENAFAPFYGAQAALELGQVDRAFEGFLLSIRIDETATAARMHAARILFAENRHTTAVEMLATTRIPPSVESKLLGLQIHARSMGADAVLKFVNKFSTSHPELFGQAIAIGAEGVSVRGDGSEAWAVIKRFISFKFPPHNHLPILLAGVEWADDEARSEIVESLVRTALEANPESAMVKLIEGVHFERSGKLQEAEASYRAALEIAPDEQATLFRLASLVAESDADEALELLSKGVGQPVGIESMKANRLLLRASAKLLDSPGISSVLETALERTPTSGAIAYRLASVLEDAEVGKDEKTAKRISQLLRRAIRFNAGPDAVALRDRVASRQ